MLLIYAAFLKPYLGQQQMQFQKEISKKRNMTFFPSKMRQKLKQNKKEGRIALIALHHYGMIRYGGAWWEMRRLYF
jgi:hypothetical protein